MKRPLPQTALLLLFALPFFACEKESLDNETGEIRASINEQHVYMDEALVFVRSNETDMHLDFWGRHYDQNGVHWGTLSFDKIRPHFGLQRLAVHNFTGKNEQASVSYFVMEDDGKTISSVFELDTQYPGNRFCIEQFDPKWETANGYFELRMVPEAKNADCYEPIIIEGKFQIRHHDLQSLFAQL